jgi:hypothetical protein
MQLDLITLLLHSVVSIQGSIQASDGAYTYVQVQDYKPEILAVNAVV